MKGNKIISAGVAAVMLAVSAVGFAAEYSGAHVQIITAKNK